MHSLRSQFYLGLLCLQLGITVLFNLSTTANLGQNLLAVLERCSLRGGFNTSVRVNE